MTVFARPEFLLLVSCLPEVKLMFANLASDPRRLDLQFCVGDRFYRQQLSLIGQIVLQVVFHDQLQVLATLHGGCTLALWRLAFDSEARRFDHRVIRQIAIPSGFELCGGYFLQNCLVARKHWQCSFGGNRVDRTELLLTDLNTFEQRRVLLPYNDQEQSTATDQALVVAETLDKKIKLRAFRINL